ncbi:DSD1 family PLP-dependent enzyme [Phaeobacter inhibens]|uniref:DSD1 family PLP-dependent enzyme n=1 Tax=Phaeobacter inhibens TaxID=221822 RepID=UPI0021A4470A|nr:DSD1 family PLP-dependent enzyme [Phaeobacter inhibens]UWR91064.1 DSD1 family PLP-dependent enzyme [Phaeobacter inhibens]
MSFAETQLKNLQTPALVLDETKMMRNIQRLAKQVDGLGVSLRPHLKTVKSTEISRRLLTDGSGPATVSTLIEAEVFAEAGGKDIIYAVGITPQKLDRVAAIRSKGCDLAVVLDSVAQAHAVADASARLGLAIPALIELDCDGHRSGVVPGDPVLLEIGRVLHDGASELRGVLTHAGESYEIQGRHGHEIFAKQERDAAVQSANALQDAGMPCPVVSIGSTPTAHSARKLDGVTEVRAGVYAFFDLVQAGIGVCDLDDIALSVLTTVLGHQHQKGWIIVDAGWMALSQDRGTANQRIDQGYGVVCDEAGQMIPDLIVIKANQEHGIIARRPGSEGKLPALPLGTRLRILPNHACAMAAQFTEYNVIPADHEADLCVWPRFGGW